MSEHPPGPPSDDTEQRRWQPPPETTGGFATQPPGPVPGQPPGYAQQPPSGQPAPGYPPPAPPGQPPGYPPSAPPGQPPGNYPPPAPQVPGGYAAAAYPVAAPSTNGAAIGSVISAGAGILLFFTCLAMPIGGLLAVILGRKARREIRASQGMQTGESMAIAGEVVGWITLALGVLLIVSVVALIVIGASTGSHGGSYARPTCYGC